MGGLGEYFDVDPVDEEAWYARTLNTQPPIQPETARTFKKKIDF
jgi:hypothetical protein